MARRLLLPLAYRAAATAAANAATATARAAAPKVKRTAGGCGSLLMARVVSLGHNCSTNESHAAEAAEILNAGHVIAVPTDTIYGLAALCQNDASVAKLYGVKGRDARKPIAICVADVDAVRRWAKVTVQDETLLQLLPGPVTLVFDRTSDLNARFNRGTSLVGVRIPDHAFIRALSRRTAGPVALTSANVSAHESSLDVAEFEHLHAQLHTVFDGGRLGGEESRRGSTVVDLSEHGVFRIIREGSALQNTRDVLAAAGLQQQ